MAKDLRELRDALRQFAVERDWDQFHSPKNLAAALVVEAAELLEHFKWMPDGQSRILGDDKKQEVAHELADVLLYLVQLSDKLGIDLLAAARDKIKLNADKYPVKPPRAVTGKYTEL
jgi:NTP pyrophosphatase (non-canonical NTP hydrolase)